MPLTNPVKTLLIAAVVICAGSLFASAQTGYNVPPKNILDVMLAPPPPMPVISPSKNSLLLVTQQDYPSIARVATPYLRLAGTRVEPKNHSKHDTPGGYGITLCLVNYSLVRLKDNSEVKVELPKDVCAGQPEWAADGSRFAFANIAADSVELWIGDGNTGKVRKVQNLRLNPMFYGELQWMPDQKTLLVKQVPNNLGEPPAEPVTLSGPSIQESLGDKGQSSTYENRDTLNNKHDEDLFAYYGTSQLAFVNAETLKVTPLGAAAIYDELDPAPDGKHLFVTSIHKPFSYVNTYDHFPHEVEVWEISNPAKIKKHTIASLPLADRVPIRGVPLGPRDFTWRATDPATLLWAEALDGGDWKVKVPARDKIMLQKAPFTTPAVEVTRTTQRFTGFRWSEQPSVAILSEYDNNRHWRQASIINLDDLSQKPRLLWDLSTDESYANPGNPVTRVLPNGIRVIRQDGDSIYLTGTGASPDGDRPFLDRLNITTLKSERLFRTDKSSVETVFSILSANPVKFYTWHQSPVDPPNAFLRTIGSAVDSPVAGEAAFNSTSVAVTHMVDPTPEVRKIKKQLYKYKRADGVDLSFTLYTPPGYVEGTRVPTILYAYPLDYADASKAGQVTGSQMTFTRLRQYRLLLLAGYAIIDNAAFPVIGDPQKAYDTYLEQLVADATAAVNKAVELGVADPNRIGVTGHSHGALMTANLVAHCDLFRAGVATSGSYNKTLTPFGFQNEQRSVWEAPDVYTKVSPFFVADKIKTPLLIMHGEEDANPGTTPIQSHKLFEAIRGNGGTTRLVILPHEPHWYTALESNEQEIYEMLNWFDKYVKNAPVK